MEPDPDRPRERMLALGAERLTDRELLAILLGTGIRGRSAEVLAADLLSHTGGLAPLSRASPRELGGTGGVGPARALRVAAAFHLGRRAVLIDRTAGPQLATAADVWWRLRAQVAGLTQEVFFVIGIDARGTVLDEVEVARGTLTGVDVHPRDVFRPLIRMAAAAGILAHNHPSGDPTPSPEDRDLTGRLQAIGELVGIPIVDHVVIGERDYRSVAGPAPAGGRRDGALGW